MNVFIYDDFLDKYKRKTKKIEESLNKLNLQGKIIYLKDTKNLKDSLLYEINNGAKTIISVGNDKTVNVIINILVNFSEKIPISIIPVGPNNSIAESLGIKNEKEACFILSSRRIEKIKLAKVNDLFFVHNFFIKNQGTLSYLDNSYKIKTDLKGFTFIYNIAPKTKIINQEEINPQDDILNLYIETKLKNKTHIKAKKIKIKNEEESGFVDNLIELSGPFEISGSEKEILMIIGKERSF